MFRHSRPSSLAGLLALVLLINLLLPATILARPLGQSQSKGEGQEKKEKKKDEAPKSAKEEREYQKIKKFSADLYTKDEDFRNEVDEAYRQRQREHAEQAYLVNTRDSDDKLVTRAGDKVTHEDTLYDNPLAQDYVNRVGQSLVPKTSNKLYAFKVTLNPIPEARALSTGTVYISSGLLSMIDNEAQLAYVLAHEIVHVERDHWREDVLVDRGLAEYNAKQQKKRSWISAGMRVGLGVVGMSGTAGAIGSALAYNEAFNPTLLPLLVKLVSPNAVISWDKDQEDEADRTGLQYMLDRNYDPREVPKFFARLRTLAQRDPRIRLGFVADTNRIDERNGMMNSMLPGIPQKNYNVGATDLASKRRGSEFDPTRDPAGRAAEADKTISGGLAPDIQAKLDAEELIGTTAEFSAVMSGLKRDNGVSAYYFDMFQMARDNLEESLRIRSNDPYAHFYYGKVLKLTARSAAEKSLALREFVVAIEQDKRRVLPESHLYRALSMIETKDPNQRDIVNSLKEYVGLYQREHSGTLPPNMDVIYDYMQDAGEMTWVASPAINVSTKNIEPIGVSSSTGSRAPATMTPVNNAVTPATTAPAPETKKPGRAGRRG